MYTEYSYVPAPVRHETKWHFGWNSCLLFMANLALLAFYTIVPDVSLRFELASITLIATLGVLSALSSIIFGKFWLSKVYATCGLIGNICLLLWLLLSL
jgi:hypothetical protein